jgi:cell division protein FtsQ
MSDRKLNMTRVRQAIVWTMLLVGIATLAVFSIRRKANEKVDGVTVSIVGVPEDKTMLTEKEVKRMLMEIVGKPLTKSGVKSLPLRRIEAKLNKDKRIEKADIYIDKSGGLHVIIRQKMPLFRVANDSGEDYYLDINGKMIPYVAGSAPRVPIVTGIKEVFSPSIFKDSTSSMLKEIYWIMHKVEKDPFMASLIEQVHVTSDSIPEIIMIPKIGREQLIVGNANDMEEKFEKLHK